MRTETNLQTGGVTTHQDATLTVFSDQEIEAKRVKDITDKANTHVLNEYSELKQRKLMSIAISLHDKKNELGLTLTQAELDMLQTIRNVNDWITAVRVIENTAIKDGTSVDGVIF